MIIVLIEQLILNDGFSTGTGITTRPSTGRVRARAGARHGHGHGHGQNVDFCDYYFEVLYSK